ncbi:unnamed protein product [Penicillium olsonii]|nr:unnamed protein product [Penicillium olsonii]
MENLDSLRNLVQSHPHIDSHAQNLLKKESTDEYLDKFLGHSTSKANGIALLKARTGLPFMRATRQLSELYGSPCADWPDAISAHSEFVNTDYEGLIRRSLVGTQALILDDLFDEYEETESFNLHDSFTASPTKRIVQIEALAESAILQVAKSERKPDESVWSNFRQRFLDAVSSAMEDPNVVGFKSVVCSRTGLGVDPYSSDDTTLAGSLVRTLDSGTTRSGFTVEDKPICHWIVQQTLKAISLGRYSGVGKPLQFDTGFGDDSTVLEGANPTNLQPLIDKYSNADMVLLHSAYPFTREAGCLASVHPNVYLSLGGPFPMISREGQEKIIRESLELTPTNRLLWSSDGRFHPETFWLANVQFRRALEMVLVDYVQHDDLGVRQAMDIAVNILFSNANQLYSLNLSPNIAPEARDEMMGNTSRT